MNRIIKYMIFNYQPENGIDDNMFLQKLHNRIYSKFQEKGIKCSKIKAGCGVWYFICSISDIKISIDMYTALLHGDNKLSSVICGIHCNFWNYLTKKDFSGPKYESTLEEAVNMVTELVIADSRYLNTQWVEMDEWKKVFLGIQAK